MDMRLLQLSSGYLRQHDRMCDRNILPGAWSFSSPRSLPSHVSVKLQNESLWQEFHAETTEMIITKNGRRMFPSVQLTVSGLEKHERYCIMLEIQPACTRRYKYCGSGAGRDEKSNTGGWNYAGPAEPQPSFDRRIYMHPDAPATGDYWMQNTVSFSKLKLTNNVVDRRNNVLLTSMHKYIPTIWIIHCNNANPTELFSQPAASFTFNETAFIAVTAYQNENITKLKINNNPFAKGFRETGQSRCKRKYQDRKTDDDKSSSSESVESNRNVNSLENNLQKKICASSISDDDPRDTATSITAGRESLTEENNNDETSTRFHRPWLDSPSSNNRRITTATSSLSQTAPPYHCPFPPHFIPSLTQMFIQQHEPNWRYVHPMFRYDKDL